MPTLSRRGRALIDAPAMPAYILEHFEHSESLWTADDSRNGYIPLCIAENKLQSPRLAELLARYPVGPEVLGYDAMIGRLEFREALSSFLERRFLGRRFPPEQIAAVAGAGSALELVFYGLCDPGDGVLVPTPSYAGFWADLETRDELSIVPVHLSSESGFALTTAALDASLDAATCNVRALLFTNPDNPTGRISSAAEVAAVVDWARSRGLHLIVDEIYALSVFGESAFTSVAEVEAALGDDIHVVWAFSKDFGASGLRCGVLISENDDLIRAVDGLAYWSAVSGHTQSLLTQLVLDRPAVDEYLEASVNSLRGSYARVVSGLERLAVPFVPADAGFFVLCDLRAHLDAPTWEAEHRLWRRIVDDAAVNLTPGSACRICEPGFFRLCYAAVEPAAIEVAVERLARVLS